MSDVSDPFRQANAILRQHSYRRWQRLQSKQQILRSQVGFSKSLPSRPAACQGCASYHGIAYGTSRDRRSMLICGIHPFGWQQDSNCPDWQKVEED